MLRIAQRLAEQKNLSSFVSGESLAQVASQTIESISTISSVLTTNKPFFKPLIGFDKQEIVEISEKINTYETSILPYEDCCTIFVAKHPVTKPNLNIIKKHEENLNEKIDELVKTALETDELIIVQ